MKRLLLALLVGVALAPLGSAQAAIIGSWLRDGQSGQVTTSIGAGGRASYVFTTTGQSPTLRLDKDCSKLQMLLVATTATLQPYVCSVTSNTSGFAYTTHCARLEGTHLETATFGPVEVTQTDPFVIDVTFGIVLLDITSGAGTLWAECRP